MRSFHHPEKGTFWRVSVEGLSVVVATGKVGRTVAPREKVVRSEKEAFEEMNRQVHRKLEEGFVEDFTGPVLPELPPEGKALEDALVEAPEEVSTHKAYADWLSEQEDALLSARGEFIQVQLALEKAEPAERRKLQARERALRKEHQHAWFGPHLGGFLLDQRADDLPSYRHQAPRGIFTLTHGWIDRLEIPYLTLALAEALAKAPFTRMLRHLVLEDTDIDPEPFMGLANVGHLANLRSLHVGGDEAHGVERFVAHLPRLEEVVITASNNTVSDVFAQRTLTELRRLHVEAGLEYPLGRLARNPAMKKLETLFVFPHAADEAEDGAFIHLGDVKAMARSPHLPSLRHLTIRLTDMGDDGLEELLVSGMLARLETVDLASGTITDAGVALLGKKGDLGRLRKLDLTGNRLTHAGKRQVRGALGPRGIEVVVADQQKRNDLGGYTDEYLYEGDAE